MVLMQVIVSEPYSSTMKLYSYYYMILRCMEQHVLNLETIFPKNKKCGEEYGGYREI